jgi:hypothetical protein
VSNTQKSDELDTFLRMQLEELLDMSDEDILEGANPDALKSESLAMVASAKAKSGNRRMAAAKAGIEVKKVSNISTLPKVSIDEARVFLEAAMNDPRYTLAARTLGEMSDADILRLYLQLHQLQSENGTADNGEK